MSSKNDDFNFPFAQVVAYNLLSLPPAKSKTAFSNVVTFQFGLQRQKKPFITYLILLNPNRTLFCSNEFVISENFQDLTVLRNFEASFFVRRIDSFFGVKEKKRSSRVELKKIRFFISSS